MTLNLLKGHFKFEIFPISGERNKFKKIGNKKKIIISRDIFNCIPNKKNVKPLKPGEDFRLFYLNYIKKVVFNQAGGVN